MAAVAARQPGARGSLVYHSSSAVPPYLAEPGVLKVCLGTAVNIMHLFCQRGFTAPSPASSSCLFLDIYLFGVFFFNPLVLTPCFTASGG